MSFDSCPLCKVKITKIKRIYCEIITPCPICLEDIDEKPCALDCGHVFHTNCIGSSVKKLLNYESQYCLGLENKIEKLNKIISNLRSDIRKSEYKYEIIINKLKVQIKKHEEEFIKLSYGKEELHDKYVDLLELYKRDQNDNSKLRKEIINLHHEISDLRHENTILEKQLIFEDKYPNILPPKPVYIPRQRPPVIPFEILDPPKRPNLIKLTLTNK